jgi:hypothetical protein
MKRFILLIILVAFIVIIISVIKFVDFGALTIVAIEQAADVTINYQNIEGNIFKGFRLSEYNVKLSDTDSVFGDIAEIRYHFKPLVFRLPNVFEIDLIEPTICIKRRMISGEKREFKLPHLNLGLRLNVKNGKFVYKDTKPYTVERIAGLVFIDLIGTKIYLNTINLSFKIKEYPINITSANLDATIEANKIEVRSFKIKGTGISLHGKGTHFFDDNRSILEFKESKIDLKEFKIHKGNVRFLGDIEYTEGRFLSKIHGTAHEVRPFDRLKFETTMLYDTLCINIFDGEIFDGTLFAQIKASDLKNWQFEANFNNLNVGSAIDSKIPLLVSGYIGYREDKFIGFLNSPLDSGLGIDSLLIYGTATRKRIYLDSLFVLEGYRSLEGKGEIFRQCDIDINFNDFDIGRFSKYLPVTGQLSGNCRLQGDFKKPADLAITSNLFARDLVYGDMAVKNLSLECTNFQPDSQPEFLKFMLNDFSYKEQNVEKIQVSIEDRDFMVKAKRNLDSLQLIGLLDKNWEGSISSLCLDYNGVRTRNISPISFNISDKRIGEIHLLFLDGELRGSFEPMRWNLVDADLKKLGKLLGLREDVEGTFHLDITEGKFFIEAQDINFSGLDSGALIAVGKYEKKSIYLDSLSISDKKLQTLYASGLLAIEDSEIDVRFANLGMWIIPPLSRFLSNPYGVITGKISFRGNMEKFSLNGNGEIKACSFGITAISTQFDSVAGKVRFSGDKIIFESAKGKAYAIQQSKLSKSKGAKVTAGGIIKLEPKFKIRNFNFDLNFKDAPIQFRPFAYGIGSGIFSIGMKDEIMRYSGNINLKEGIVPLNFGMRIKQEKEQTDDKWTMNLRLRAKRNIWLRNREADIDFGGELYIIKEQAPLYISGNLETHRGNFYWLGHVLSITRGKITFIPEEKIDPELDIWAEMDTREGIKIILHCFGQMSEPIFEFFSDPPLYSEQDILTYLNLNITWQELESMKRGEYVGKVLPHSLLSWLESDVSRRIRQYTGVDYFRIETPFFEADEKTKLTVGKYISRNLFITYTYDITTFSNEFNVEYFIDDKNEILIRRDEEGEYSLQYQYRIRF